MEEENVGVRMRALEDEGIDVRCAGHLVCGIQGCPAEQLDGKWVHLMAVRVQDLARGGSRAIAADQQTARV